MSYVREAKLMHEYESYRQPKLMMFNEFTVYDNIIILNRIIKID
jgi:hypothetical protein